MYLNPIYKNMQFYKCISSYGNSVATYIFKNKYGCLICCITLLYIYIYIYIYI